jgi:hypothetical protein
MFISSFRVGVQLFAFKCFNVFMFGVSLGEAIDR